MEGFEASLRIERLNAWERAAPNVYRFVRDMPTPFPVTAGAWMPPSYAVNNNQGNHPRHPIEACLGTFFMAAGCTWPFPNPRNIATATDVYAPRCYVDENRLQHSQAEQLGERWKPEESLPSPLTSSPREEPSAESPLMPPKFLNCGKASRIAHESVTSSVEFLGVGQHSQRQPDVNGVGTSSALVAVTTRKMKANSLEPWRKPHTFETIILNTNAQKGTSDHDDEKKRDAPPQQGASPRQRGATPPLPMSSTTERDYSWPTTWGRPTGHLVLPNVAQTLVTSPSSVWVAGTVNSTEQRSIDAVAVLDKERLLSSSSKKVFFDDSNATSFISRGASQVLQLTRAPAGILNDPSSCVLSLERNCVTLYDSREGANRSTVTSDQQQQPSNEAWRSLPHRFKYSKNHADGLGIPNSITTWRVGGDGGDCGASSGGEGICSTRGYCCAIGTDNGVHLWDMRKMGFSVNTIYTAALKEEDDGHQVVVVPPASMPLTTRANRCLSVVSLPPANTTWNNFELPMAAAVGSQVVLLDASIPAATASGTVGSGRGEPFFVHSGHTADVTHLAPHPSEDCVLSAAADGGVQLWSPNL